MSQFDLGVSSLPTIVPIPKNPLLAPERLNPAKWAYERLVEQIVEFEKSLSAEEEIGGRFVTAPREGAIHIENLGYWAPDVLVFYGKDADGRSVQLIQHHSQLSVLLCAVPKEKDEPRQNRIYFGRATKEVISRKLCIPA